MLSWTSPVHRRSSRFWFLISKVILSGGWIPLMNNVIWSYRIQERRRISVLSNPIQRIALTLRTSILVSSHRIIFYFCLSVQTFKDIRYLIRSEREDKRAALHSYRIQLNRILLFARHGPLKNVSHPLCTQLWPNESLTSSRINTKYAFARLLLLVRSIRSLFFVSKYSVFFFASNLLQMDIYNMSKEKTVRERERETEENMTTMINLAFVCVHAWMKKKDRNTDDKKHLTSTRLSWTQCKKRKDKD